jgi:hypothetical protein
VFSSVTQSCVMTWSNPSPPPAKNIVSQPDSLGTAEDLPLLGLALWERQSRGGRLQRVAGTEKGWQAARKSEGREGYKAMVD